MNNKTKMFKYFDLFSNKKIEELSELFSDDIILKDWDINSSGKDNVLESIKNIFEKINSISISLNEYYEDNNNSICEITLDADNNKINIVDIITFDETGKIQKINAYKQ